MHLMFIPGHGADGAPCPKGSHRNLSDCRKYLRGELPATPKKPLVGVVGPDQDGEEQVYNVRSSVSVDPQERELWNPRDWGHSSRRRPRNAWNPLHYEGLSIGGSRWGRSVITGPTEPRWNRRGVRRFEDLSHWPRWPTSPGVGHGIQCPALPAAAGGSTGVNKASAYVESVLASQTVRAFSV